MKLIKVVIFLMTLTSGLYAQSQIKSGVYSLSGSIGYSSSSSESKSPESSISKSTSTSFTVVPGGSYFLTDRFELSVSPFYNRSSFGLGSSSDMHTTTLGITLGGRYYYPLESIAPFIGAGGGVTWFKPGGATYSKPSTNYAFILGFDYFITQSLAIEPGIQYRVLEYNTYTDKTTSVSIGIKYFIP